MTKDFGNWLKEKKFDCDCPRGDSIGEAVVSVQALGEWYWKNGGEEFAKEASKYPEYNAKREPKYFFENLLGSAKGFAEYNGRTCVHAEKHIQGDRFLKAVDCLGMKEVERRLSEAKQKCK